MIKLYTILTFFLTFPIIINAKYIQRDTLESVSVLGCALYLSRINTWDFQGSSKNQLYDSICNYEPALGSWSTCIYDSILDKHTSNNNDIFENTLDIIKSTCSLVNSEIYTLTKGDYYDILNNASRYLDEDNSFYKYKIINFPIIVNDTTRTRYKNAYHIYFQNIDTSNFYIYYYYVYLFCFFVCSGLINYFNHTNQSRYITTFKFLNIFKSFYNRGLFKAYHTRYYYFTKSLFIGLLPTISETIVIFGYVCLTVFLLFHGYTVDEFLVLFKSTKLQMLRYIADRSGILAFGNLPIIFLFCTRNNLLMVITGSNFATFIGLHKWIGRIMIINSLIHSMCYLSYSIISGSLEFTKLQLYYKCGIGAMVIGILTFVLSLGYMRKHYYETFLYSHIILSIGFMYACWRHVENLGWKNWLMASLLIWIIERSVRILSILRNGSLLKAKLILIENIQNREDDLIRVTIKRDNKVNSKPGQYYFIYFIHPLIFWQSHPFTIIESESKNTTTIVLKPKSGASETLYKLLQNTGGAIEIKVALEGPYGCSAPIRHSDKILLLAAGTGMPGPLFHAMQLTNTLKENYNKSVKLLIIVRNRTILNAFKDEILSLKDRKIEIDIYITREKGIKGITNHNEHSQLLSSGLNFDELKTFAKIKYGRPDLTRTIQKSIIPSKTISILVCGAPEFVDSLRDVTSTVMKKNPNNLIDYYEEFQRW